MSPQIANSNGPTSIPVKPLHFSPPAAVFQGLSHGGRLFISHADGESKWHHVEYSPFHDERGSILGILGLLRDDRTLSPEGESDTLKLRASLDEARQRHQLRYGHAKLIGSGPRHERLAEQMTTASKVNSTVLIVGERGTGRRLVGELIHAQGAGPTSPFFAVDVAALSAEQIEQILFTFVERSDASCRPTVFLSNVETLPRDIQERLVGELRQERFRLIASITVDPEVAYREGKFREDFYFAITPLVLRTAPLRERIDELPLLAQHFLEQADLRLQPYRRDVGKEALASLATYDWPGNVAELARVVQAAAHSTNDRQITRSHLPAEILGELAAAYAPPNQPTAITPMDEWLTRIERRLIEKALEKARHNKSRAAELLDISRPRLYRRIKELGIAELVDAEESSE